MNCQRCGQTIHFGPRGCDCTEKRRQEERSEPLTEEQLRWLDDQINDSVLTRVDVALPGTILRLLRRCAPVFVECESGVLERRVIYDVKHDLIWFHGDASGYESGDFVLDLIDPVGRDIAVRWAGEGERCPACIEVDGPCGTTRCTGWLRPPTDLSWARDMPEALRWACLRLHEGLPVRGSLGPWMHGECCYLTSSPKECWKHVMIDDCAGGWSGPSDEGPETGNAGKEALDKAAIEAGWWLADGPFVAGEV